MPKFKEGDYVMIVKPYHTPTNGKVVEVLSFYTDNTTEPKYLVRLDITNEIGMYYERDLRRI